MKEPLPVPTLPYAANPQGSMGMYQIPASTMQQYPQVPQMYVPPPAGYPQVSPPASLQYVSDPSATAVGAAYSNQGPVQPYGSHAPSHVTSVPYQPSQLSQGHGPSQAPLQPPTNSHQGFANQQQVLPQIPYQQISYQQGVPGAPPEYPSQSAPQDYSSQYFTQASMAGYPNFPAQPQMVYSQQPLL
ncbi:unnamed protein product [Porites evermanni]|uniref:Uncharacterized protein n=1 Tax=Porites evermanni TaxID=104178 RepID=A0ABN8LZN5_9CNID|nr:unnamed protein product [Porites evermanni]